MVNPEGAALRAWGRHGAMVDLTELTKHEVCLLHARHALRSVSDISNNWEAFVTHEDGPKDLICLVRCLNLASFPPPQDASDTSNDYPRFSAAFSIPNPMLMNLAMNFAATTFTVAATACRLGSSLTSVASEARWPNTRNYGHDQMKLDYERLILGTSGNIDSHAPIFFADHQANPPCREGIFRFLDAIGPDHLKTSFWQEWYQDFLDGEPLDLELQRRIALIPDEDWEKGPEHIAKVIEEIRARFELEKRIQELERELISASSIRHGIGGNNPPEQIDDATPVARELLFIWQPLQDLKHEVEAEAPKPERIKQALAQLGAALAKCTAWVGRKADLAVDTTIKEGIKIAVKTGGVLVALEAVMEAAKAWLSFLP